MAIMTFQALRKYATSAAAKRTSTRLVLPPPPSSSLSSSLSSSYSSSSTSCTTIDVLPEVADALASGRPVVALESTIVAHGMPYPQNLELAKDVSKILRNKGVIPATIAIKDGIFRAGLHPDELENLSKAGEEGRAVKCSTRDLPLVASKHRRRRMYYRHHHASGSNSVSSSSSFEEESVQWGATTVAATMRLAHAAGISTFVTGGTGGVHRGGEHTLDVSTDLIELSRTPVIVVSAGVKSILDAKRTLELLETHAVPVGTWKSREFPSFFSPVSGVMSPSTFDDAEDVARAYLIGRDELGLKSGMLVAVPNHDPAGQNVEIAIQEALREADAAGIEGRDVTPFILRTVAEKTGGDSLRSNMSLVKNNAEVGADIANSIRDLSLLGDGTKGSSFTSFRKPSGSSSPSSASSSSSSSSSPVDRRQPRVVCVGGAVVDTVAKSGADREMIIGTSNPGDVHCSHGGVGRNVAEVLGRLGSEPLFYTAVGDDDAGHGLIARLGGECGVATTAESVVRVVAAAGTTGSNTAQYLALLDHNGDLVGGVADMEALGNIPVPSVHELDGVEFLVLDSNPPVEAVTEAAKRGNEAGCLVCFEPTSVPKAKQLSNRDSFVECLDYVFPNEDELFALAGESEEVGGGCSDDYEHVRDAATRLLSRMKSETACIVITLGSRGVMLAKKAGMSSAGFTHFPADAVSEIKSSNGAGDTLCGAFIHSLLQGSSEKEAVQFGMKAALLSLDCAEHAISPHISSLATSGAPYKK